MSSRFDLYKCDLHKQVRRVKETNMRQQRQMNILVMMIVHDDDADDEEADDEEDEDSNGETEMDIESVSFEGGRSKKRQDTDKRIYGGDEDYTDEEAENAGTELNPFDNPNYFRDECDKIDMRHLTNQDIESNLPDVLAGDNYVDDAADLDDLLNDTDESEPYVNTSLKSAQSYISDTFPKHASEGKEYRCIKSAKGSAAKIKPPILSEEESSSCDSQDPFRVLIKKVETVQVSRPLTPDIICLDDNLVIKPSRFSAQAAKSISGVMPSVQQSAIMVHSTTDHDVDDGNLIIKPSRFSAQPAKSISGVTPSVQQSAIMVHSTTDNYVDDETVDEDLRCLASAIQRKRKFKYQ